MRTSGNDTGFDRSIQRLGRALAALGLIGATAAFAVGGDAGPAGADPSCAADDGIVTCTIAFSGAPESWTAPDEVVEANVVLNGAGGGSGPSGPGGQGGQASTMIAPPDVGATWEVRVGGAGQSVGACNEQSGARVGGYNGGGAGGTYLDGFCEDASAGGGTDLRIGGSALADRMLVAGGGGGSINGACCANGGAGGGATGGEGLAVGSPIGDGAVGGAGGNADGTTGSGVAGQGQAGWSNASGGAGGGGWYGGAAGVGFAGGGGGSGHGPVGSVLTPGAGSSAATDGDAAIRWPVPATADAVTPTATTADIAIETDATTNAVEVWAIWGTDPASLDQMTEPLTIPPGAGAATLSLSGLDATTTYHYLVFTSIDGVGTTRGALDSFATVAPPATTTTVAPTTTTSIATTTTVAPTTTTSIATTTTTKAPVSSTGSLPRTGGAPISLVLASGAAVVVGAAFVTVARIRRRQA